jgi:predicted DNA-binding transcriptional regulator
VSIALSFNDKDKEDEERLQQEKAIAAEPDRERHRAKSSARDSLSGTTRRVYRYIYRRGPVRLYDIQRDLGLSSSSVADYHVQKLLRIGLIKQDQGQTGVVGYVAEEAVFEAMLRIRRTVIPVWTTATVFFAACLILLMTVLRPSTITSTFVFSLAMGAVALLISLYETFRSLGGGDQL